MATKPSYTTRERVKAAAGFAERSDDLVDQAVAAASRTVDADTHRVFYPSTETRVFDWRPPQTSRSWRLWITPDELISLTTLTVAGVVQTNSDFFLEPANDGPPYSHIEVDLSTSAAWSADQTHQRAVSIVGLWGYDNETVTAGTTSANVADTTSTALSVTNGGLIGVGDLITLEGERRVVTGVDFADTTKTTTGAPTAQKNDVTITAGAAHGIIVGETIRINSEQMKVEGVDATTVTVERNVNGSTLAAHSASDAIWANRALTTERGSTGSTAATSTAGDAITRQQYPSLIEQWCTAEAIVELAQKSAAYARTAGQGDNTRETVGKGLVALRERALAAHGRRVRMGVV